MTAEAPITGALEDQALVRAKVERLFREARRAVEEEVQDELRGERITEEMMRLRLI